VRAYASGRLDTVYVCCMCICLGVRRQLPDNHAGGRPCIADAGWKRKPTVSVVTAGRLMRDGVGGLQARFIAQ